MEWKQVEEKLLHTNRDVGLLDEEWNQCLLPLGFLEPIRLVCVEPVFLLFYSPPLSWDRT